MCSVSNYVYPVSCMTAFCVVLGTCAFFHLAIHGVSFYADFASCVWTIFTMTLKCFSTLLPDFAVMQASAIQEMLILQQFSCYKKTPHRFDSFTNFQYYTL